MFYRNDKLSSRMYSQAYGRVQNRLKISKEKLNLQLR